MIYCSVQKKINKKSSVRLYNISHCTSVQYTICILVSLNNLVMNFTSLPFYVNITSFHIQSIYAVNYLKEVGCEGMDWIKLVHDKERWRALVNAVMSLWVP